MYTVYGIVTPKMFELTNRAFQSIENLVFIIISKLLLFTIGLYFFYLYKCRFFIVQFYSTWKRVNLKKTYELCNKIINFCSEAGCLK